MTLVIQAPTWTSWYVNNRDDIGVILGVVGILLSIVGFWIALHQIKKTRGAAEAAEKATQKTRFLIGKRLIFADATACVKNLGEIRQFLSTSRYDAALMRLEDLIGALIQLQHASKAAQSETKVKFPSTISQMTILRSELQAKVNNESYALQVDSLYSQLFLASDELNKLIAGTLNSPDEFLNHE